MPYIKPDWSLPTQFQAFTTTRQGGVSQGCYADNNIASHVTEPNAFWMANRAQLRQQLPAEPYWLKQTHSDRVLNLDLLDDFVPDCIDADAAFTAKPNRVCAVMTADCLPVLIADVAQQKVAAVHAGWRGLAQGIIEKTLSVMQANPDSTYLWLGPAIGADAFEVGDDVYQTFCLQHTDYQLAFKAGQTAQKWLADIYQLARLRLIKQGYTQVSGGQYCTFTQSDLFYSYRRDAQTGRMVSVIWFT